MLGKELLLKLLTPSSGCFAATFSPWEKVTRPCLTAGIKPQHCRVVALHGVDVRPLAVRLLVGAAEGHVLRVGEAVRVVECGEEPLRRLSLRLEPTHPDLAGGLGFLEQATMAFLSVQVAVGAVLGGRLVMDLRRGVSTLGEVKQEVLAFGLVTIEALFSGTPVLGTRRGALPELITPEVGALSDKMDEIIALAETIHTRDPLACRATFPSKG